MTDDERWFPESSRRDVSRRSILFGAGGLLAGAGAGAAGAFAARDGSTRGDASSRAAAAVPVRGAPVTAAGPHQAGITRPATPQTAGLLTVLDLPDLRADGMVPAVTQLRRRLRAVGDEVLRLTEGGSDLLPDGAGDLTVTVGLGPRVLALIDPELPGAAELPAFAGDEAIEPHRVGGDLLLALHASDAGVLAPALRQLRRASGGRLRWTEPCFRAPGHGTISRNPLGYLDGIVVPRTEDELADDVWLDGDERTAGATVCVVRRLRLDVRRFTAEDPGRQDAVIGRRRSDGAPLSGGDAPSGAGPGDDVDLRAKTPEGDYLVPVRAHARAAHPSFTGSGLMLRRGYTFVGPKIVDGEPETGLFFISFQRDLDTFVGTQLRLDETDELMTYVTPTASAVFLVLPGFDATRPLGATLLDV